MFREKLIVTVVVITKTVLQIIFRIGNERIFFSFWKFFNVIRKFVVECKVRRRKGRILFFTIGPSDKSKLGYLQYKNTCFYFLTGSRFTKFLRQICKIFCNFEPKKLEIILV